MKRLVILLGVSITLVAPSAALASGVVLKVQSARHLVAVTNGKTKVSLVHTAAKLQVGQRIALKGRTLRNGTVAASSIRVVGRVRTVHFRGLLLKRSGARLVLSAGGAVISVNRGAARTTSSATDAGPQPGATVEVTATVGADDELDEDGVTTVSADAPGGAIEGKLTIGVGKVTVVSEHMALVINVPSTFDLSKFVNGDEVLAKFTQGADGTLTLTALSGDDNVQEADHDNGDDDSGDDHSGHGDGGGGDD
jgi:hypothetical protein